VGLCALLLKWGRVDPEVLQVALLVAHLVIRKAAAAAAGAAVVSAAAASPQPRSCPDLTAVWNASVGLISGRPGRYCSPDLQNQASCTSFTQLEGPPHHTLLFLPVQVTALFVVDISSLMPPPPTAKPAAVKVEEVQQVVNSSEEVKGPGPEAAAQTAAAPMDVEGSTAAGDVPVAPAPESKAPEAPAPVEGEAAQSDAPPAAEAAAAAAHAEAAENGVGKADAPSVPDAEAAAAGATTTPAAPPAPPAVKQDAAGSSAVDEHSKDKPKQAEVKAEVKKDRRDPERVAPASIKLSACRQKGVLLEPHSYSLTSKARSHCNQTETFATYDVPVMMLDSCCLLRSEQL